MYKRTLKKEQRDRICKRMRDVKTASLNRRAIELGPRPAPYAPPKLRRVVVVIDYDLGPKIDVFRLFRSGRIDSYRAEHNLKPIDGRLGWANFCKRLSAHYPRLQSPSPERD